jgi:pSer/pThr/pTyr-binding forkhead associated (FHA) protein
VNVGDGGTHRFTLLQSEMSADQALLSFHHVSREHFLIDTKHELYVLIDRGSFCGTIVGGQRAGGQIELRNEDVVIIGTVDSPYVFKFVVP